MSFVRGNNCVFAVNVLGDYLPVVCSKSFSLNVSTEDIEITTKGDGQYRNYDYNSLSYTLSLNGFVKLADTLNTSAFDLLASQMGFSEIPYRLIFEDDNDNVKLVEGTAIIMNSDFSVTADQYTDFTFDLKGKGEFTIRETIEACNAYIADTLFNILFTSNEPTSSAYNVSINTVTGEWAKIDYRIDGGAWYSSYYKNWTLPVLAPGTYTIDIAPVCSSGIRGTTVTRTLNV